MKTLYVLRHAKSDWSVAGQRDYNRGLNNRGLNDSSMLGSFLEQTGVRPGHIYCSGAVRTRETLKHVSKNWGHDAKVTYSDELYESAPQNYMHIINSASDTTDSIMLIGHNPTCSLLVSGLCTGDEWNNIAEFPTCALACIETGALKWKDVKYGNSSLKWFVIPKMLKQIL